MSGTWGAPILPSGLDQFTAKLQPDPQPVDDLSRFVLQRIRAAETEPRIDMVPQAYSKPAGAMAHRYAGNMRRDMVAFRRIVAEYCDQVSRGSAGTGDPVLAAGLDGMADGLQTAVQAIAMRFADHPDFKPEWGIE